MQAMLTSHLVSATQRERVCRRQITDAISNVPLEINIGCLNILLYFVKGPILTAQKKTYCA